MIHLRLATRAIPGSTNDPHNAGIREPRTGPGLEGGLNYAPIAKPFLENPQEFAVAFAKAWYKVTHRDLEPVARYLGPHAVAAVDHPLMGEAERAAPKVEILASWLSILELV